MAFNVFSDATHVVSANPIALTFDTTLLADVHTDRVLTNVGASGNIHHTLPNAIVGRTLHFLLCQNGPEVRFTCQGADNIVWLGNDTGIATYMFCNDLYACLTLVCAEDNKWVVWGQPTGSWSIGPV